MNTLSMDLIFLIGMFTWVGVVYRITPFKGWFDIFLFMALTNVCFITMGVVFQHTHIGKFLYVY